MEGLSYEELEAATKGFAIEMLIGKGSHGCVYKGITRSGRIIAVKKLLRTRSKSDKARLQKEIEILASINSPQFVNTIGVGQGEEKLILMEYMPNGSLHDLLHIAPKPPPWPQRLMIALQIARAMQVLHQANPRIIHRDIKSSNVLFDSSWNARLADFSLAVRQESSDLPAPSPAGTIGYLDPSYTGPGKLGPKNDIFSYGVILLELISGRQVMDAGYEMTSILAWAEPLLSSGLVTEVCDPRLALPYNMKKIISQVLRMAHRSISLEAEKRPSAGEIVEKLQSLVERLQLSIWDYLKQKFYRRICPSFSNWMRRRSHKTTTRIICLEHQWEEEDESLLTATSS